MKTLFISSTFKDMQAERDAIKRITLSAVNTAARNHNDEFDFCDLRWGVDTAEMETNEGVKKVLEVCLDEIDRCQPPMVVLLGYRYGWIPDEKLIKNAAKAKEMQLEDLKKSVTALEIEYGAFKNCRTLYYFREIDGQAPEDYQSEDKEHAQKLSALKQLIYEKSGGKIKTYQLKWNGKGFDGTEDFAEMLAEDIKAMLMPEWIGNGKLSPLQCEMRVHDKFISDKKEVFSARSKEADELKQCILNQPVTIMKGAVGSGKSTLFGKLATDLEQTEWKVLPFVSGLTNQSNDAQAIIENIIEFLETELNVSEHYKDEKDRQAGENICHTPEQQREKLAEMCSRYTQEKHQKLLIMIDAVDQLSQSQQRDELHFIPLNVGKNIHFAMTSTLDFDTRSMDFYTLKDIDENDKKEVISRTLKRVHKQLSKKVVDKIVSLKTSENPLYISLLVQRLVLMDEDDFKIIRELGDGMPAIEQHQIDLINGCPDDLDEMSAELLCVAAKGIDEKLVAKAGEYLAVSRYGLRKSDLAELLGEDWTEIKFSHFINFMYDCFMLRDDGRFDFTHKSIRAGFLKKCDSEKLNLEIFKHLKALPDNDPVRIAEVVYHAIQADDKRFFIDYIIEYEYNKDKSYISQSALDTYYQCISDKGRWICDILGNFELFEIDEDTTNFINFINFELREKFTVKLYELYIQLDVLTANRFLAEYICDKSETSMNRRALYICYEDLAGIYEMLGGWENIEKARDMYKQFMELSRQLYESAKTKRDVMLENMVTRDLSVSYEKLANVYEQLEGMENYQKAAELYQKRLELAEQLYMIKDTGKIDDDTKNEIERDLAISYRKRAEIYKISGDKENVEKALELYKKSLDILKNMDAGENIIERKRDLYFGYRCLSKIYLIINGRDNLEEALRMYKKGFEFVKQLYTIENTNANKRDLSSNYDELAEIYTEIGGRENLEEALKLYEKSLDIREKLYIAEKSNFIRVDLAASYYHIARIYDQLGNRENLEKALNLYNESLDIMEQFYAIDKTVQIKKKLSDNYECAVGIYVQFGSREDLQKALELCKKGIDIRKCIYDFEKTNSSKRDLSIIYKETAIVYEMLGGINNLEKAFELCEEYMKMSEQIYASEKTNRSKRELAVSYNEMALVYEKLGGRENIQKAFELHKKSLNLKEQLAASEKTNCAYDDLAVGLYNFSRYFPPFDRKSLLERALKIVMKLYNDEPNDRRKRLIERICQDISWINAMSSRPDGKIVSGTANIEKIVINRETKRISFTAVCIIPAVCKMVRGGLVATNDKNIGKNVSAEKGYYNYLKIAKTVTEKTKKLKYTWTPSDVKENDIWYVRAYLVYKDADENEVTIYSNVVKADLKGVIQ